MIGRCLWVAVLILHGSSTEVVVSYIPYQHGNIHDFVYPTPVMAGCGSMPGSGEGALGGTPSKHLHIDYNGATSLPSCWDVEASCQAVTKAKQVPQPVRHLVS